MTERSNLNLVQNSSMVPFSLLSGKETSALEEYISENLKKGFIRKLKSPASVSVLFVLKKEW